MIEVQLAGLGLTEEEGLLEEAPVPILKEESATKAAYKSEIAVKRALLLVILIVPVSVLLIFWQIFDSSANFGGGRAAFNHTILTVAGERYSLPSQPGLCRTREAQTVLDSHLRGLWLCNTLMARRSTLRMLRIHGVLSKI